MRKGRNPAAFLAMFAGLLCLTLDISLSAGWGTFDLLPDFLGYLLFFLSCNFILQTGRYAPCENYFRWARGIAFAAFLVSLAIVFRSANAIRFGNFVILLSSVLGFVLSWFILSAIRRIAAVVGAEALAGKCLPCLWLQLGAFLVSGSFLLTGGLLKQMIPLYLVLAAILIATRIFYFILLWQAHKLFDGREDSFVLPDRGPEL